MKQVKTAVSDQTDTRRKQAALYANLSNPEFAKVAAERIAANPDLLQGLAGVVAQISKHPLAADILARVFTDEVAKQHPGAYSAFLNSRLFAGS